MYVRSGILMECQCGTGACAFVCCDWQELAANARVRRTFFFSLSGHLHLCSGCFRRRVFNTYLLITPICPSFSVFAKYPSGLTVSPVGGVFFFFFDIQCVRVQGAAGVFIKVIKKRIKRQTRRVSKVDFLFDVELSLCTLIYSREWD